jgi:hypothetical protein
VRDPDLHQGRIGRGCTGHSHRRAEDRGTSGDGPDRLNEVLFISIFQHIAPRSCSKSQEHRIIILEERHDEDTDIRTLFEDLACRCDSADVRHLQIHQDQIRSELRGQLYRLGAIGGVPYNLEVGHACQDRAHAFANQRMVVSDQYA